VRLRSLEFEVEQLTRLGLTERDCTDAVVQLDAVFLKLVEREKSFLLEIACYHYGYLLGQIYDSDFSR
jgi:hypothetical protein